MVKKTVDYQDADLVLRLYDLRRESVLRRSRDSIIGKFWPRSYADVQAIARLDHPLNAAFRQVSTYWEMVYGFARNGIVNPDFLAENNREGIFLLARMLPYLEQLRADTAPTAFRNAEWLTRNCEEGARVLALFESRVKQRLAAMASAPAPKRVATARKPATKKAPRPQPKRKKASRSK